MQEPTNTQDSQDESLNDSKLYKMGAFDEEGKIRPHIFQKQYFINREEPVPVLEIVTDQSPIGLFLQLLQVFPEPYTIIYDLVSPQTELEEGSYVWEDELSTTDLINLIEPKAAYLENDARHRLACHVNALALTLVLDEHNVVKSLPADGRIVMKLGELGFIQQRFEIPFPHSHPIHSQYNGIEDEWLSDDRWVLLSPEELGEESRFV